MRAYLVDADRHTHEHVLDTFHHDTVNPAPQQRTKKKEKMEQHPLITSHRAEKTGKRGGHSHRMFDTTACLTMLVVIPGTEKGSY